MAFHVHIKGLGGHAGDTLLTQEDPHSDLIHHWECHLNDYSVSRVGTFLTAKHDLEDDRGSN